MTMLDLPLFYAPEIEQTNVLPEEEAGHALRVLRLSEGEPIMVTNGQGQVWKAHISEVSKKHCGVILDEELPWNKYWQGTINLYIAPTKSIERMEWLIEKAIEIGVDKVTLIKCAHSERKHIKSERLQKIMLSAMKQSQKALLPLLEVDVPFKDALKQSADGISLLFHCKEDDEHSTFKKKQLPQHALTDMNSSINLFIGPEGDFSSEEIMQAEQAGVQPSTLGASRLRTETAALTALQWVHVLQNINTNCN